MHTLDVPYHPQEQPYSCGPAALRMLLAYYGTKVTEESLVEALRTSFEGTCNDMLADVASQYRAITARTELALHEIFAHVAGGTPVLVNYRNPVGEYGHFAVLVGHSDTHVVLHDPKNGPHFTLPHSEFESRWRSGDGAHVRWGLVFEK